MKTGNTKHRNKENHMKKKHKWDKHEPRKATKTWKGNGQEKDRRNNNLRLTAEKETRNKKDGKKTTYED